MSKPLAGRFVAGNVAAGRDHGANVHVEAFDRLRRGEHATDLLRVREGRRDALPVALPDGGVGRVTLAERTYRRARQGAAKRDARRLRSAPEHPPASWLRRASARSTTHRADAGAREARCTTGCGTTVCRASGRPVRPSISTRVISVTRRPCHSRHTRYQTAARSVGAIQAPTTSFVSSSGTPSARDKPCVVRRLGRASSHAMQCNATK